MNIILFGFKGCGKTYYGKQLADSLGRSFIDTDDLLAERHGMSVEKIYEMVGETRFRELESAVIYSLADVENAVIALGGGAVLDPANVSFLQTIGGLLYLEVSLETVLKRITKTPSFVKDKNLEAIYRERLPIYESIPARKINCGV